METGALSAPETGDLPVAGGVGGLLCFGLALLLSLKLINHAGRVGW